MKHRYPASGTLYELLRRTGGLRLSTVRDWTEHLLRSMGRLHQRNKTIQGIGHVRTSTFWIAGLILSRPTVYACSGAGITSDTIVFASDERPLFATAGYMGILLGTLPCTPFCRDSTALFQRCCFVLRGFGTTAAMKQSVDWDGVDRQRRWYVLLPRALLQARFVNYQAAELGSIGFIPSVGLRRRRWTGPRLWPSTARAL